MTRDEDLGDFSISINSFRLIFPFPNIVWTLSLREYISILINSLSK